MHSVERRPLDRRFVAQRSMMAGNETKQRDVVMRNSNYETDFYGWANEQAALLRAGQLSAADIENIAEEIESMGRGEKRELVNRLSVLLAHLLKWRFQR